MRAAGLLSKDIWRISSQKRDDDLPDEIKNNFQEWHSGHLLLGSLTLTRSYFTEHFDRKEFHFFGDSSQDVWKTRQFLSSMFCQTKPFHSENGRDSVQL